jgi:succinate dehydrogenase/fumarate reductase cytochrome b subunit
MEGMPMKAVHRAAAVLLASFIVVHLGVHLTALGGSSMHLAALHSVQWVYRNTLGELLLILAIVTQIATGARRLQFAETRGWAKAQAVSGVYLIFFLVVHTGAALYTHHIYGLETNFYWAAGSLHYAPIKYGFAIYYVSAIIAVFAHWAAALHFHWPDAPGAVVKALPIAGAALAVAIVLAFWGAFYHVEIPGAVAEYYQVIFGGFGIDPHS